MAAVKLEPGPGVTDDKEVSEEGARKYIPPQVFPLMKNPVFSFQSALFHRVRLVFLLVEMPASATDVAQLLRLVM